jgi:hypothetical protein
MATVKVKGATRQHGITKRRWWIVIRAFLGPSINYIGSVSVGAALGSIGQEFLLNQATLCLIPASNQQVRRTSIRKTI